MYRMEHNTILSVILLYTIMCVLKVILNNIFRRDFVQKCLFCKYDLKLLLPPRMHMASGFQSGKATNSSAGNPSKS